MNVSMSNDSKIYEVLMRIDSKIEEGIKLLK
jgi:hypothetical protein